VGHSEAAYCQIVREFGAFVRKLGITDATFIPISALHGDNVVDASENMPWYDGPPLLEFLEQVEVADPLPQRLRLPVQVVIRPHQDYRGFAGRLESGTIRVGDTVEVSSTGLRANVRTIHVSGVEAERATSGQAVSVALDREIDVSRGDLLYAPSDPPVQSDRVEAVICWMHESPLAIGKRYLLLHTTSRISAIVEQVLHRVDVDTLEPGPSTTLGLNDIGRVILRTANPLFFDPYSETPGMGSFVLVDPNTYATVAGGMIQSSAKSTDSGNREALEGKAIWLRGFDANCGDFARAIRAFGQPVVVIGASDDVSSDDLEDWILRLTSQGLNVLISDREPPLGGVLRFNRTDFPLPQTVLEAILSAVTVSTGFTYRL
jgi:bifunctional enzyme CysN/CysC